MNKLALKINRKILIMFKIRVILAIQFTVLFQTILSVQNEYPQCQIINRKYTKWSITAESQIKQTRSVVINRFKYFVQDPDQCLWVLL